MARETRRPPPPDGRRTGGLAPDEVELLEAIHRRLVRSLTLHCGDPLLGEELAHDAVVRVIERWSTLRDPAAREAWALRIGFNLASSRFRRVAAERRALQRHHGRASTEGPPPGPSALGATVRDAVAELPPRQRTAVVCRYLLDLSVAETADLMGCRPGTVKAHCSHALAHLSRTLDGVLDPISEVSRDA